MGRVDKKTRLLCTVREIRRFHPLPFFALWISEWPFCNFDDSRRLKECLLMGKAEVALGQKKSNFKKLFYLWCYARKLFPIRRNAFPKKKSPDK